jgi:hypothetical protein
MRTPIRSETEANRFVFLSAAVIAVSVLIGWLVTPLVGVLVFAVAVAVAGIAYVRAGNPDHRPRLREAAHESHPHGAGPGTRHILVVANEVLAGDALREKLTGVGGERVELDVLAPVLTSHLHSVMSDTDRELADARARLDRSLAWARERGLEARGEVGDPSATTAIEDELRDFGADEVVVVTHVRERETWQEHGELERLRAELDVPVTHVVIANAGASDDDRTASLG